MCELVSITTAGIMSASAAAAAVEAGTVALIHTVTVMEVASVLGAGMSAMTAYNQSQAQQNQSAYQAAMARNNQISANYAADSTRKQGTIEEQRYRMKVAQLKDKQKTSLAASGVEIDSGSPLDVLADTAEMGEWDAQMIRHNTSMKVWEHQVAGNNAGAQAGLYSNASSNQSPLLAGTTTLVNGLGSVADKWYARA